MRQRPPSSTCWPTSVTTAGWHRPIWGRPQCAWSLIIVQMRAALLVGHSWSGDGFSPTPSSDAAWAWAEVTVTVVVCVRPGPAAATLRRSFGATSRSACSSLRSSCWAFTVWSRSTASSAIALRSASHEGANPAVAARYLQLPPQAQLASNAFLFVPRPLPEGVSICCSRRTPPSSTRMWTEHGGSGDRERLRGLRSRRSTSSPLPLSRRPMPSTVSTCVAHFGCRQLLGTP
jgi:hypothetical protein